MDNKNRMQQLTKEQAIAFHNSNEWQNWDNEQLVRFQLFQDKLAIPFNKFHEAMESVLKRPVFTHEFAFINDLIEEYLGVKPAPSFEEIIGLIPAEKRIIIGL